MNTRKKIRQAVARKLAETEKRASAHPAFRAVLNRSKTSIEIALACFADEAYLIGSGRDWRMEVCGSWWNSADHARCPDAIIYRYAILS